MMGKKNRAPRADLSPLSKLDTEKHGLGDEWWTKQVRWVTTNPGPHEKEIADLAEEVADTAPPEETTPLRVPAAAIVSPE